MAGFSSPLRSLRPYPGACRDIFSSFDCIRVLSPTRGSTRMVSPKPTSQRSPAYHHHPPVTMRASHMNLGGHWPFLGGGRVTMRTQAFQSLGTPAPTLSCPCTKEKGSLPPSELSPLQGPGSSLGASNISLLLPTPPQRTSSPSALRQCHLPLWS